MKFSLEHIGLAARDSEALKDWYVRVLGAEVRFNNCAEPPAFLLALPGGPLLEIYPAGFAKTETRDNSLAGLRHLALRVASLEAAQASLVSRGVSFDEPIQPAGGGGRVLFFSDPEGNLLHLVERPADWRLSAIHS